MHEHISQCKIFLDKTFSSPIDLCDANISLPQCLHNDKVFSRNFRVTNCFFTFLTCILSCRLPCMRNCKYFSHKPLRRELCPINLAQQSFHRPKNAMCTGMHACVGEINFSFSCKIFSYGFLSLWGHRIKFKQQREDQCGSCARMSLINGEIKYQSCQLLVQIALLIRL